MSGRFISRRPMQDDRIRLDRTKGLPGEITAHRIGIYPGVHHFPHNSIGGSVAKWPTRRTRNPAVPAGSSPAVATCWIC